MPDSAATTYARHYASRGWSPVPIPFKAKAPVIDAWQTLRITPADVDRYFNGVPLNVGVILGTASNGLTDVDCDCREAVRLAQRFLAPTGFIFGRKGNPASHRGYICSPVPTHTQYRDTTGKMMLEVRTNGQTVFPGSVHPSGEPIEFIAGASEPAEEDGNFLLALTSKVAAACILARHSPTEGARHDFGLALAGGLARVGWDVEDIVEFVNEVCTTAGHTDIDDREAGARDTYAKVKAGDKTTGWPSLGKLVGKDVVAKVLEWLGIDRREAEQQPEPAPTSTLVALSIRELVARHPQLRPPVIHGVLREGETMNIIAPPKAGKSWLVTDLALSLKTGRTWLGTYQTTPGDVLILDNELHGETSASRIPKVAAARGILFDEYADGVRVVNMRGQLQDLYSIGKYFATLQPGQYKAVILDAFYRFLPRDTDENDNGSIASLYNLIDNYADRLRCCFILIHHQSKGQQGQKVVTDVGAGAGSQSRATDTHLVLRQHQEPGAVVLDAAVRSWAPIAPLCLDWTFPTFNPAPHLNPAALVGVKPPKVDDEADDTPGKIVWTPDLFREKFITQEPQTRDEILDLAEREPGLSIRRAKTLLNVCISSRKAYVWTFGGRAVKEKIATIEQPVTATGDA